MFDMRLFFLSSCFVFCFSKDPKGQRIRFVFCFFFKTPECQGTLFAQTSQNSSGHRRVGDKTVQIPVLGGPQAHFLPSQLYALSWIFRVGLEGSCGWEQLSAALT